MSRHDTVRQAIARYAPNKRIAEAMGLGALLEGGSLGRGPFNVGDSGHSRGPFQENDMFHNYDHKKITNPDYAVEYILPSYQAAIKKVPHDLWNTNPERAAEMTAFFAERPAKDYYSTEDVHAKWLALHGQKGPALQHEPFDLMANTTDSGLGSLGQMTLGGISLTVIIAIVIVIVLLKKR